MVTQRAFHRKGHRGALQSKLQVRAGHWACLLLAACTDSGDVECNLLVRRELELVRYQLDIAGRIALALEPGVWTGPSERGWAALTPSASVF